MRLESYFDPDFGCIATARDDDGRIVATGASYVEDGTYIAVDEAALYEATGQLIPLETWEQAKDDIRDLPD